MAGKRNSRKVVVPVDADVEVVSLHERPISKFTTALDPIMMEALYSSDIVCVDFETTVLTPWMPAGVYGKSAKIGDMTLHQYSKKYNCNTSTTPRARVLSVGTSRGAWAVDLDALTSDEKSELILSAIDGKKIVGHNLQFDLAWAHSIVADVVPERILDTMLISRTFYPESEVALRTRVANNELSSSVAKDAVDIIIRADSASSNDGGGFASLAATVVICGLPAPDKSYQKPVNWIPEYLSDGHYDYCVSDATLPLILLRRITALSAGRDYASVVSGKYDELPVSAALEMLDTLPGAAAYKVVERAIPKLVQMQAKGVFIDSQAAQKLRNTRCDAAVDIYQQHLATVLPKFEREILESGESDALKNALNAATGMRLPLTETGKPSTAVGALTLSGLIENPIIEKYIQIKKLVSESDKIMSYVAISDESSRIHPDIGIKTVTLRTSSQNPNLQGVPRGADIRALFAAQPGHKILAIDYSAIELRIAAALTYRSFKWFYQLLKNYKNGAGDGLGWLIPTIRSLIDNPQAAPEDPHKLLRGMDDGNVLEVGIEKWRDYYAHEIAEKYIAVRNRGWLFAMRDAFRNKVDPHLATGLYLLSLKNEFDLCGKGPVEYLSGLSINEQEALKKQYKSARQLGKPLNFGLLYGMGVDKLHQSGITGYGLTWSMEDARDGWHAWHDLYPEIGLWQTLTKLSKLWKGEDGNTKKHNIAMYNKGHLGYDSARKVYTGTTLSGRKVVRYDSGQALNFQDQGTGAEIALAAISDLPDDIAQYLVLFIHDELVFEVPEHRAEEVQKTVEKVMVASANRLLDPYGVPCEVEGVLGNCWIH